MINEAVTLTARNYGCLNEMFIEGKRNLQTGSFILAYRSKIWVFPDQNSMEEASKRMISSINKEVKPKNKFKGLDTSTFEERPDVLQAEYNKNETNGRSWLTILPGFNNQHQMETSVLVKKVAQALKVNNVVYAEQNTGDELQRSPTNHLQPGDPTWGYHGTSTRWLFDILKTGIVPQPDKTNFKNIKHEDHIFLTMDPAKAMFHANTATRGMGSGNYQPVILKVKIPDPSLIDADYDIDQESGQTQFTDMHRRMPRAKGAKGTMPGNPVKLSKNFGVFGYKGKILPQQITEVLIGTKKEEYYGDDNSFSEFDSFTPQQIRKSYAELQDLSGDDSEYLGMIDLKDFFNNPENVLDELRTQREEMERENAE